MFYSRVDGVDIQALELIWIHRGLVRLRAALLSSPPKFALSIFALRGPEFFVHVKGYLFPLLTHPLVMPLLSASLVPSSPHPSEHWIWDVSRRALRGFSLSWFLFFFLSLQPQNDLRSIYGGLQRPL
jgi:hypothetical protein